VNDEIEKGNNMMRRKPTWLVVGTILMVILACPAISGLYTIAALNWARKEGIYATPVEGVIANANRWYCDVQRVTIEHASTNSLDGSSPHVWYVVWRVYANHHAPCDSENPGKPLHHQTYESGGQFYLNMKDGWVMMPEGMFPQFIGEWMGILQLDGPGDPTHIPTEGWWPIERPTPSP
jgi:hypothetical protein